MANPKLTRYHQPDNPDHDQESHGNWAEEMPEGETVTLFHGTTKDGELNIRKSGIEQPAFFTSRKEIAEGYGDGTVLRVRVPKRMLKIDFDLPNGKLLTVEEANNYSGNTNWTIDDYLKNGHSVGIDRRVNWKGSLVG